MQVYGCKRAHKSSHLDFWGVIFEILEVVYLLSSDLFCELGFEGREKESQDGSSQSRAGEMHHDAPHSLQGNPDQGVLHHVHLLFKGNFIILSLSHVIFQKRSRIDEDVSFDSSD